MKQLSVVLCCCSFFSWQLCAVLIGQDVGANASSTTSLPSAAEPPKIPLMHNYDEAVEAARQMERPLVVVLGAEWCGPCKALEKELEQESAEPLFRQWIIVKIDVDQESRLAADWEVNSIPAFRILGVDQEVLASNEGLASLKRFREWLNSHFEEANPITQKWLHSKEPLTLEAIKNVLVLLKDRSPKTRAKAMERLQTDPRLSMPEVVGLLRDGNLSQRLCALQLLDAWHAPVAGIDPWEPDSIAQQRMADLQTWIASQVASSTSTDSTDNPEPLPTEDGK